jgi:hypothetical protein
LKFVSVLADTFYSGYKYLGTIYSAPTPSQCVSIATSGEVVTYIGYSSGTWTPNSTTFGPSGGTIIGGQLNGYKFADALTTSSSSVTSVATTTSSTTAQNTSSSTATSSSNSSGGLSSGAKVGLGVGVAIGVLGIVALIAAFILYKRSRAKGNNTAPELGAPEADHFLGTSHPGGPSTPSMTSSDIKKQQIPMNEMYSPPYVNEVHADTHRAEMAA